MNDNVSFYDAILGDRDTANETCLNLIKEQPSIFGEEYFADNDADDGPSPFEAELANEMNV